LPARRRSPRGAAQWTKPSRQARRTCPHRPATKKRNNAVAVIAYAVGLAIVYLMAWIIDALAPKFGGEKDVVKSLQLIAYSYTAAWVAGIFPLVPMTGSLLALAA
jgi:hypothetical protein